MPSDTIAIDLADARALMREALQAFLPPERLSVADCAAVHRWLNNPGAYVGKWQHARTPYLVEPMEVLTSREHLAVVVAGPARCGKTEIAVNWLLQSVLTDPANLLWYMPSEPALTSFVKSEIAPLIELHEGVKQRLGPRPVDDSLGFKRFRGMTAQFLTVAYNNLISKTASRIVLDEIDAYPEGLGDVYALADLRRQTAGMDSMILAVSHPDRARGRSDRHWNSGIMRLYAQSDRRAWWWPCPHCGAWSSPNPTAARVMVLDYPADASLDEIEQGACLRCPTCGAEIDDDMRAAMNAQGKWVGIGQEIDEDGTVTGELVHRRIAGFWIVGVMSPFIIGGVGALARAYESARREFESDATDEQQRALKDVVVKRLGVPYEPPRRIGSLDANTIADRAEADLVPAGVRFLTAFVDVQGNRFEILVRGWGSEAESWIIEHRRHAANPAASSEAWDELLADVLDGVWPLADGSGRVMRVRAVGVDSGGLPGVTAQAYAAWRRLFLRKRARLLGRFDGRESWSLMLTKGLGGPNAPRLTVTRPDSERKDRSARARGAVPVAQFNANGFKDDLAGQLSRGESGPRYVHFPDALRAPAPPHPFFEQLVAETRKPNGVWEKSAARNEALDLMVGTHVIAHLNGLARINWDHPPAWAAEWDRNSLVGTAQSPLDMKEAALKGDPQRVMSGVTSDRVSAGDAAASGATPASLEVPAAVRRLVSRLV